MFLGRSPVFSHVKASYDGLATIRSSFAQNKYKLEFDELQVTIQHLDIFLILLIIIVFLRILILRPGT